MLVYNFFILLMKLGAWITSFFNNKNKKLILGHRNTIKTIFKSKIFDVNDEIIWFHSASLGEFEQARPIIESIKERFPNYKILISFFSPSGYEIRKKYNLSKSTVFHIFHKNRE